MTLFSYTFYCFVILILFFEIGCLVTEVRSKTRKPCQFPFVLLNKTFNECTDILSINPETGKITTVDEPWCSTKVDPKTYKHIEGGSYYGNCPRNCQAQEAKEGY